MVFLNITDINDTNDYKEKMNQLIHYYSNPNTKLFMLIYMNGCGPCNATRPEWSKLKNVLKKYKNDKNIIIVDIDKDILEKVKLPPGFENPSSFPTLVYIHKKQSENYEDANELEESDKNRTVDSFVKWIETKVGKNTQIGGSYGNVSNMKRVSTANRQKGGIFIDETDTNAFMHFLENSKIDIS